MHLIGQLKFDLQCTGATHAEGFDWQQRASRFCHEKLMPALELRFSQLVGEADLLQIDSLEIDGGQFTARREGDWEEVLRAVVQAVGLAIEKQQFERPAADREGQTIALGFFKKWLLFLETGRLSMVSETISRGFLGEKALAEVAGSARSVARLRRVLMEKPTALERLLRQHDETFLQKLAEAFSGHSFQKMSSGRAEFAAFLRLFFQQKTRANEIVFSKKGVFKNETQAASRAVFRELQTDFGEKFWLVAWEMQLENPAARPDPAAIFRQILKRAGLAESVFQTEFARLDGLKSGRFPLLETFVAAGGAAFIFEKTGADVSSNFSKKEDLPADHFSEKQPADFAEKRAADLLKNEKAGPAEQLIQYQPGATQSVENQELKHQRAAEKSLAESPETPLFEYVRGAGMVIFHPFLLPFLAGLSLIKNADFVSLKARSRAVYLLHFLATGESKPAEYDVALSKFLCNWPTGEPLFRPPVISKKTRTEADRLLEAVLGHWKKLGSTSPDGLRNGFLNRAGKLHFSDADGWRLRVEQSGIDILLNYLPWGIGIVKLPWMPALLTVEWPS